MKSFAKNLNYALIILFILAVLFTGYKLVVLPQDLIYQSKELDVGAFSSVQHVFNALNLAVGATFVIGLITIYVVGQRREEKVVYIHKKKDESGGSQESTEEGQETVFDLSFINQIVSGKDESEEKYRKALTALCSQLEASQGAIYMIQGEKNKRLLELYTSYAMSLAESTKPTFEFGEGLVGQAAQSEKTLIIDDIPDNYIKIISGLGSASPTHLAVVPFKLDGKLHGVAELSSFQKFSEQDIKMVEQTLAKLVQNLESGTKEKTQKPSIKSTKS